MTVHAPSEGRREAIGAGDIQARLMLVVLCLIWGITWPVMKIALEQIPPLGMRATTAGLGATTLLAICLIKRRSLRVSSARAWAHIAVSSLLNVVSFSVLSAFAQNAAATSRVAIVTYTMPIWAVLLAWLVLRERPTPVQGLAVVLCVAGLAVLIWPLAASGIPLGLVLAAASGLGWAAGTVYLKWARIEADPMGAASWQLVIAFIVIAACMLIFEGPPHLEAAPADALLCVAFTGLIGNGTAYGIWFVIVPRLSAVTASLGVLGSPVIGVASSILVLGERPTVADIIGFALILAASACVLLSPPAPARDVERARP
jgi:drug/metabolite transporter (DMT)-like permease